MIPSKLFFKRKKNKSNGSTPLALRSLSLSRARLREAGRQWLGAKSTPAARLAGVAINQSIHPHPSSSRA